MNSDEERALIVFRRTDPASAIDLVTRGRQELHSLQALSDRDEAAAAFAEGMRFHALHFDGDRLEEDLFAAVHWLRIAASKGHMEAQYTLGRLFSLDNGMVGGYYIGPEGDEVTERPSSDFIYHERVDPFDWFLAAAEQGHALAQWEVGKMIYDRRYVFEVMNRPKKFDIEQSLRWWRAAADQDVNLAKERVAGLYERGEAQDQQRSSWRRSDESQHAGRDWSHGWSHVWAKKDVTAALNIVRKAAMQGHPLRQDVLGCMLYDGENVPQDDVEAVQWFRKAAEQGLALSQYHLGRAYAEGRGVHKDDLTARRWFIAAAEQGNEAAKNALALVVRAGTESAVAPK